MEAFLPASPPYSMTPVEEDIGKRGNHEAILCSAGLAIRAEFRRTLTQRKFKYGGWQDQSRYRTMPYRPISFVNVEYTLVNDDGGLRKSVTLG